MFFDDGSRFIELDDRWNFYVLYEKYSSASSPNKRFAFVGYMTVYKFYTYPEHIRPRVSQLVILPPFQEMGHATRLLETVYEHLTPLPEVVDITVEDPSEDLIRLRDFLDCKRCLQLAECAEILCEKKTEVQDGGEDAPPSAKRRRQSTTVVEGQSASAATRFSDVARKRLKLSRAQSRRVYQILTFFLLVREKPEAVRAYHRALLERTRITHVSINW
ncbi:unnamed protein product [Mesocestoides corti]|uniref:Histone acetyltransferase n=2 Tax=Mesocestoides corti TaxID=53468 RepID=A0A3P6GHI4_MESCO|nr:unnamed protein product [Mesocestoides corti]